jgi:hypothetical protein
MIRDDKDQITCQELFMHAQDVQWLARYLITHLEAGSQ